MDSTISMNIVSGCFLGGLSLCRMECAGRIFLLYKYSILCKVTPRSQFTQKQYIMHFCELPVIDLRRTT